MAFVRYCYVLVVFLFCMGNAQSQTVYYPARCSQLLKSTAADLAMLLQHSIAGSHFTVQEYQIKPSSGIVLIYDSTYATDGSCTVEGNGSSLLSFIAAEDNGLNTGVYGYLQQCGFRFYQPGSIWEIIPTLSSPFMQIHQNFSSNFKYNNWFISGGHNRWVMDNDASYSWDSYFGETGHNWSLYQRRNGMTGSYRFAGHRGDIMTGTYLNSLQHNPCYVACYNGSRIAENQSVPDVHSNNAMQLWSNSIDNQYTQFKNTIFGNRELYADYYRNFNYYHGQIGIEVPDGARWGNSQDNSSCGNATYPSESDQAFTLANYTAQQLASHYSGQQLQAYAYAAHANIPSFAINPAIDIQVIPSAFQNESSTRGLLNRWYNASSHISEYHYLNIPQWGGETPMFYLRDMQSALDRAWDKKNQGLVWEASPAKFASLPFLLAANNNLKNKAPIDSSLHAFCDEMFGAAANSIYTLLQWWSDDKSITTGDFIQDNQYKLPRYLQLLNTAVQETRQSDPVVQERIRELKAYLHYMRLYYSWTTDQRSAQAKKAVAAKLCLYLARTHRMAIVNSYFLITDISSRYAPEDDFYKQYNVQNGTAYLNGNLPLITATEIEDDFLADLSAMGNLVQHYDLLASETIRQRFKNTNLAPLKKISVQILYTNGADYPNRSEYYIDAPAAGSFTIQYTPHFNMPKGYINFTVEATDKALQVIKDFSINQTGTAGTLVINLPAAGTYKLSVQSKYKSAVDLVINTNGNYFYKNGPFLGNKTENYRADLLSLPGYFYVPANLGKLYFSINNSNPGGVGFASPEIISKAFVIKDNHGTIVVPHLVTPNDSALFYIDVPVSSSNSFWQATTMGQYNLCFANISNLQWYAKTSICNQANFSIAMVRKNGICITELTAAASNASYHWEVFDLGKTTRYENQRVVDLPDNSSPNALISLMVGTDCQLSKRLSDDPAYLRQKEACASGAPMGDPAAPVLYPNPSSGNFICVQQSASLAADAIIITNAQGVQIGKFNKVRQFSISNYPAGVYWYQLVSNGKTFTGKLVKL